MAITVIVWIAFLVGGVVMVLLSRRTPSPPEPPAPPPPGADRRPVVRGTGQLLFARPDGRGLRVDCALVGDDAEGVGPGSLLTFRLFPPRLPALTAPFEALLCRWADDLRIVDLELRPCHDGWRLRLDDGDLRINLEISEPARVG